MDTARNRAAAGATEQTSDLNWLLHRAAQRMGDALDAEAMRHGITIRDQLVLSALAAEPGRAQLAIGAALGVDKTTLTTVLDRLERRGLVRRGPDPQDRRVRIPEVTAAGRALQLEVAGAVHAVERELLQAVPTDERTALRSALRRLADSAAGTHRPPGSCM